MFWITPMWFYTPTYVPSFSQISPPPQTIITEEQRQNPPEQVELEQGEQKIRERQQFWKFFKRLLRRKYIRPQKKAWTMADDQNLFKFHAKKLQWQQIADKLQISNPINCQRRFYRLQKLKKKWPEEIDIMIRKLVEINKMKWIDIAKSIELEFQNSVSYTGKMIRERYKNYLRPGIEKKQWEIKDDLKLMKLVFKYGTLWSQYAEQMQGRSELQLKNRYHGILQPMRKKALRKIHEINKKEKNLHQNIN